MSGQERLELLKVGRGVVVLVQLLLGVGDQARVRADAPDDRPEELGLLLLDEDETAQGALVLLAERRLPGASDDLLQGLAVACVKRHVQPPVRRFGGLWRCHRTRPAGTPRPAAAPAPRPRIRCSPP